MSALVRATQPGDEEQLARSLRDADRREVYAATGLEPLAVLQRAVEHSLIACSIVDARTDTVVGMFGAVVAPDWDQAGILWLLGAEALVRPPIGLQFLRESKRYCLTFHNRFSLLIACLDERNAAHIRWMQWMGFTLFARHEHYGFEQRPFLEYVRTKHV